MEYFALNFNALGIRKLVATCYDGSPISGNELPLIFDVSGEEPKRIAYKVEITEVTDVNGDGAINLADVAYLLQNDKKFLIVGNQNNVTYAEIFPLIMGNKLWLGYKSGDMAFRVPADSEPRETRYWQDETGQKWRSFGNIYALPASKTKAL